MSEAKLSLWANSAVGPSIYRDWVDVSYEERTADGYCCCGVAASVHPKFLPLFLSAPALLAVAKALVVWDDGVLGGQVLGLGDGSLLEVIEAARSALRKAGV